MFTLTQVQYIFDYGMWAFYQCAEKTRDDAVKKAALIAAAATKKIDKESKMIVATRDEVITAGIQAVVFNKHLIGEAHQEAFDIQFALSMKIGLEKLFAVESISAYDKTSNNPPVFPVALLIAKEEPSTVEQSIVFKAPSNFSPQFFTPTVPTHEVDKIAGLDKTILDF